MKRRSFLRSLVAAVVASPIIARLSEGFAVNKPSFKASEINAAWINASYEETFIWYPSVWTKFVKR